MVSRGHNKLISFLESAMAQDLKVPLKEDKGMSNLNNQYRPADALAPYISWSSADMALTNLAQNILCLECKGLISITGTQSFCIKPLLFIRRISARKNLLVSHLQMNGSDYPR